MKSPVVWRGRRKNDLSSYEHRSKTAPEGAVHFMLGARLVAHDVQRKLDEQCAIVVVRFSAKEVMS